MSDIHPTDEMINDWWQRQVEISDQIESLPIWAWWRQRKLFKEWDRIFNESEHWEGYEKPPSTA
jgi:hypothetical protein